ncbi:kinase-like domain-containing protein [Glomus cerebriforme]|uniref:Kinase-like domain-containing protein n=1 Tax=Glomus cerebriforme TaxID=658196 RepID=A0A397TCA3_9GLOM|nr:kinase-like domain-containing protein [Glomus cerebriforme]
MSVIRKELVYAALNRAYALIDPNIHDDIYKEYEFQEKTILADKSLTKDEKKEAIIMLNRDYDRNKILFNSGTKRICENCNQECLATLYCEHCIRNYLKAKFSNWTSENNVIDNLIQKCQMETLGPDKISEWIPYNNFKDIRYLTKGGWSEIHTADWIGGKYCEWDSKKKELKRNGEQNVVLKRLETICNRSLFNEVKAHLTLSNKYDFISPCFGLTRDPSNGSYMLVMNKLDMNLREYLQQNYNNLTWQGKVQIILNIIMGLKNIHKENLIHRDLHSGNILFYQYTNSWYISDFGFCGTADKSLNSIYGNLSYIAPEVIVGKGYTFASDIYSIAMLMWEISSGEPPFANYKNDYENDYEFVMYVVDGMRPKIISETPLKYKELMERCWDANPIERPDIDTLLDEISEMNKLYQNTLDDNKTEEQEGINLQFLIFINF